jgi:hypothetical protein
MIVLDMDITYINEEVLRLRRFVKRTIVKKKKSWLRGVVKKTFVKEVLE